MVPYGRAFAIHSTSFHFSGFICQLSPKTRYHRKCCLAIFTLFYNNQYGALLCFHNYAGAYEYIEYSYGFVMLLTLYSVGTIVKKQCQG